MYERLSRLSVVQASVPPPVLTSEDQFRAWVEGQLAATPAQPLRYSTRLAFLDHAHRLGVGRFDANLIIASVQHRLGVSSAPGAFSRRRLGFSALLLTFVAIQSLLIVAYYAVAHG